MPINLLADDNETKPVNLLAEEEAEQNQPLPPFESLSPADQEQVMKMARQKIDEQHPNLPPWLRDLMLRLTPKNGSPTLDSAARGVSNVTDYIPAAAGGALQGASLPIRGVASLIPTEFTQNLANSKDLRELFAKPKTGGQKAVQDTSEFLGALGPLGKLFGALKGASVAAKIPKAAQNAAALAGTGYIGTPGSQTDKVIGAGEGLALGAAGKAVGKVASKAGEKLPAFLRGLSSKSTPEALVEAVQKPHDKLLSTADEQYGQVRSAIKSRGIKIPVSEEYLNQVAEILPKTRASRQLIEKAKSGDYEAVHDLQSHLFKKGTKGLASDDIALENQGEEILDLRNKINEGLENHLIKEGHLDIAHVLRQGKKTYKNIMDTYYPQHLRKGIGKMVQSDLRLVPENPEKLFSQNSVPMKDFLSKHPEAAKHTQGIKEKEKAIKDLKKIFLGTGIAGGTASGGKMLYELFK